MLIPLSILAMWKLNSSVFLKIVGVKMRVFMLHFSRLIRVENTVALAGSFSVIFNCRRAFTGDFFKRIRHTLGAS